MANESYSEKILERLDQLESRIFNGYDSSILEPSLEYSKRREKRIAVMEARIAELEQQSTKALQVLRAPLMDVVVLLEDLEQVIEQNTRRRNRFTIKKIHDLALDALVSFDGLILFHKIGEIIDQYEAISFHELVNDVIRQGSEKAVEIHCGSGLDSIWIYGDRPRLSLALNALIDNACKFKGPSKKVRIEIKTREEKGQIFFDINDNGIGIDTDYHERIFEPFFKINPESKGSGLGLALARRIIELHGGNIWVNSNVKSAGGATFSFCLTPTRRN